MPELPKEKTKKAECNVVAENLNWSTRVKAESDAAKAWEADWGSLYSDGSTEASSKISQLEAKLQAVTGDKRLLSVHSLSYGWPKPLQEPLERSKKSTLIQGIDIKTPEAKLDNESSLQ